LLLLATGYLVLIRDNRSHALALFATAWEQTAIIELITTMVNFGEKNEENGSLDTPDGQYYFVSGLLTITFLCLLFYGAIGVVLFVLHDVTSDKPPKPASYWEGRLTFYSFMFFAVGIVRFLMPGAKLINDRGSELVNGALLMPKGVPGGPIWFPAIEIFLGVTCVLIGIWGMLRGKGMVNRDDGSFGAVVGCNYILYFVLKVCVTMGYFPFGMAPGHAASTVAVVFLPGHMILAYLDDKARMHSPPKLEDPTPTPSPSTEKAVPIAGSALPTVTGEASDNTKAEIVEDLP